MKIEHSPKELYDKALFHLKNKQSENLLETCTLLLNNFSDSKEAKLALTNFPIIWDKDDKRVSFKDLHTFELNDNRGLTGGKVATYITGIMAMISLFELLSQNLDPQATWLFGLFGGATISLYLSSRRCAIGWIMGTIMWIVGGFLGIIISLLLMLIFISILGINP